MRMFLQTQQILVNQSSPGPGQSARIITPQGTIVTQNTPQGQTLVQTTQNNGPIPQQNSLAALQQRASPHPQQIQPQKKVVVQPNNANNDMDDLEESITAAIVQKHPINETVNASPQFHNPPQAMRPNHAAGPVTQQHQQLTFAPQQQGFQQQIVYEQPQHHLQQHPQTLTQLLMDPDPGDDNQILALSNGQRITLAEYKRIQQQQAPRGPMQFQQVR